LIKSEAKITAIWIPKVWFFWCFFDSSCRGVPGSPRDRPDTPNAPQRRPLEVIFAPGQPKGDPWRSFLEHLGHKMTYNIVALMDFLFFSRRSLFFTKFSAKLRQSVSLSCVFLLFLLFVLSFSPFCLTSFLFLLSFFPSPFPPTLPYRGDFRVRGKEGLKPLQVWQILARNSKNLNSAKLCRHLKQESCTPAPLEG
jgi:hypothetical protein